MIYEVVVGSCWFLSSALFSTWANTAFLIAYKDPLLHTLIRFCGSAVFGAIFYAIYGGISFSDIPLLIRALFHPACLLWMANYANSISLKMSGITVTYIVKALIPAFTVIYFRLSGQRHPFLIYLSLIPICFGVALASTGDVEFSFLGLLAALFSALAQTLMNISIKKVRTEKSISGPKAFLIMAIVCTVLTALVATGNAVTTMAIPVSNISRGGSAHARVNFQQGGIQSERRDYLRAAGDVHNTTTNNGGSGITTMVPAPVDKNKNNKMKIEYLSLHGGEADQLRDRLLHSTTTTGITTATAATTVTAEGSYDHSNSTTSKTRLRGDGIQQLRGDHGETVAPPMVLGDDGNNDKATRPLTLSDAIASSLLHGEHYLILLALAAALAYYMEYSLNFVFVGFVSSVTFSVCDIARRLSIILAGAVVFHKTLTGLNWVGIVIALCGVLWYSLLEHTYSNRNSASSNNDSNVSNRGGQLQQGAEEQLDGLLLSSGSDHSINNCIGIGSNNSFQTLPRSQSFNKQLYTSDARKNNSSSNSSLPLGDNNYRAVTVGKSSAGTGTGALFSKKKNSGDDSDAVAV